MGVKLAAPEREVYVMVGDGSYLMAPGELATAAARGIRIVLVLVQNHGYASIGALSRSVGGGDFGTHGTLPVDLAANAESLGVPVRRAADVGELRAALAAARDASGPVAIHVEVDRYDNVGGYESWWDVPVAAVSERPEVVAARERYEHDRRAQRTYLRTP
jgi:3D-(3,5/4)-trihydroxycyclohexane-1,2-dione acylhydrolase (decyclizing)